MPVDPESFKRSPPLSEAALVEKLLTAYSARADFIEILDEWMEWPLSVEYFNIHPPASEDKRVGDDDAKEAHLFQIKDQIMGALSALRERCSLSALEDPQKQVLADFLLPLLIGLKRENDRWIKEFSEKLGDKMEQVDKAIKHVLREAFEEYKATGEYIPEDELRMRLDRQIKIEQQDIAYSLTACEESNLTLRVAAEAFVELCDKAGIPVKKEYRSIWGSGVRSPNP